MQTTWRAKLIVQKSAEQLALFLNASTQLMKLMARACGHNHLSQFNVEDLTTWDYDMARLTGIEYAGVGMNS